MSRFTVTFEGTPPDPTAVGDKLHIEGTVTVHGITADLIDISSWDSGKEYIPGKVSIDLYSNKLTVEPAA